MKPITPSSSEQPHESEKLRENDEFRQRFSAKADRLRQCHENKKAIDQLVQILSRPFTADPASSIDARALVPVSSRLVDFFRVKVRSTLPRHATTTALSPAIMSEILRRVMESPIIVEENSSSTSIAIRQVIVVKGVEERDLTVTVTGCFKSSVAAFPTLESFDVNIQS